jgi:predicted MFS family arabinose efflux permease
MIAQKPQYRLRTFLIVWLGQVVSLVGSGLTSFGLGVWVFQQTGSATHFALIGLAVVLPRVLLSPLAGAVVDRWDRRRAMIVGDAGAGLSTLILAALFLANRLDLWPIYLLTGVNAAFGTLQWPAFTATTSLLVPDEQLGRANGLMQFGLAASEILAPALAGMLLGLIGLGGIMLIDVATFVVAVASLSLVRFPQHRTQGTGPKEGESLRQDMALGWRYIVARPGLRYLLLFFAAVNFLWGMVGALISPMILGWASSEVLGAVVSVAGVGMFAGSLLMSAWGGPRRRIYGVLAFETFSGACFVLMGLRPSFWPVAVGAFGAHVTIAVVMGCNQAIWQRQVAPEIQGRVFATQQMVARAASPLAYLLAGPLADRLMEPLLAPGGPLVPGLGQLLGSGPGRGIGLLFVLMGVAKVAISLAGWLNPQIRNVEGPLPAGRGQETVGQQV